MLDPFMVLQYWIQYNFRVNVSEDLESSQGPYGIKEKITENCKQLVLIFGFIIHKSVYKLYMYKSFMMIFHLSMKNVCKIYICYFSMDNHIFNISKLIYLI